MGHMRTLRLVWLCILLAMAGPAVHGAAAPEIPADAPVAEKIEASVDAAVEASVEASIDASTQEDVEETLLDSLVGTSAGLDAQPEVDAPEVAAPVLDEAQRAELLLQESLITLQSLIVLRDRLQSDIHATTKEMGDAVTDVGRADLLLRIESLKADLDSTEANISEIATGADLGSLGPAEEQTFNFQQELFSLLEPLMKELKGLTSHVRAKAAQRDKIAYFSERLPVAEEAISNLDRLLENTTEPQLRESLTAMQGEWTDQLAFFTAQLQTAEFQLAKLENSEVSLTEASQSYFKTFVRTRGLYLGEAVLVVLGVLLLGRFIYRLLERFMPGYRAELRSFRTRLFDLLFRIGIIIAAILGPMVVFYLAEDWLLFSVGLLLLLGIALALRTAIPRFWHQIQLFLNIGSVREGERLDVDGLPWLVKKINFFTELENPTAGLELRMKIDELVDLRSRPYTGAEPWFPCHKGDWVMFPDTKRGKVVGISPELTQVIERGGAHRTFTTADFLAQSPTNLSTNFRIKETLGISYDNLKISTTKVLSELEAYLQSRLEAEGYADALLNLRIEFEQANDSSLDVVVIADFSGQLADIYNRLRRMIRRLCVDASIEHGWEIPFPQVTVHRAD